MELRLGKGGICHGGDHAAGPVEAVGGDLAGSVGKVSGGGVDVGVERHHRVQRVGGVGDPLNGAGLFRHIGTQLQQGYKIVAVDADGAVGTLHAALAIAGIRVVGRALIMGRQYVLYILRRDLLLRHQAPG